MSILNKTLRVFGVKLSRVRKSRRSSPEDIEYLKFSNKMADRRMKALEHYYLKSLSNSEKRERLAP